MLEFELGNCGSGGLLEPLQLSGNNKTTSGLGINCSGVRRIYESGLHHGLSLHAILILSTIILTIDELHALKNYRDLVRMTIYE